MTILSGSDKYRVKPQDRVLTWEQQVIQMSKTVIRIEDVLSKYYNIDVPYEAVSWKVRCPYAFEHADGGLDKQFRVYSDSNTGWCFEMHGRIDNLSLYRDQHPYMSFFESAKALLDDFDVSYRKKSYQELFEDIVENKGPSINYVDIVDAMKLYLSAFPSYSLHEYDDRVTERINEFNSQAKIVCIKYGSLEEVDRWYRQQKNIMREFLLSLNG